MKLRNKKTGEVVEAFEGGPIDLYFYPNGHKGGNEFDRKTYQSLAELNDEWEDYKPKEPLVKDEKVRKAVRAWAEAQGMTEFYCANDGYEIYCGDDALCIQFDGEPFQFAEKNRPYTIEELCGEEEE